ncbi:peptidase M16 [Erythrobacter sp. QSSC1-22B]|uniref:M16 family metallopeptidase n=1 Tax=Erythrobacter sp. QSSC1-22B TaxID=1860125 RepID=UPI00080525A8|nr:insulinase family protein [Erythrobacter sp. QSSC1-22B]OBX20895.1 peptidase M16 [Erythrobacter sp. QSSC1-22B]
MTIFTRAARQLAFFAPIALFALQPVVAQEIALPVSAPAPAALQTGDEVPWIYRGSDVPRDDEWLFGEMDNGLRYAVRRNGVPPDQASIRVRIDAGSLHETEDERGYAHLLEHLLFRESKYLGTSQAIPTWQRLGATFGSDTNAETSPTHTVYKLDLPNIDAAKLEESMKLLSGMVRQPVLSDTTVGAEVPIVLAEMRERGGAAQRSADASRATLFAGQPLATRNPIGTVETLQAATGRSVDAFHRRWYRPENTVIVAVGDVDPMLLAAQIEAKFGDWEGRGDPTPAPSFGDPVAPEGTDPANPVGEAVVIVEPDLPRSLTYAVLRPWRPVQDTIVYNQGLLRDSLAQALINRRLESRARAGGSYLYAQVQQDDVSRSTDATFVSMAPLSDDWDTALRDVRAVIADALATPPTEEEIDREIAEFEQVFESSVAERSVMAGGRLADDIVQAVDIREAVAAPETVLTVFRGMKDAITPQQILDHTRALFAGSVIRSAYVTPAAGEASAEELRVALAAPVEPDGSARLTAATIAFDELPPIGEPGEVVRAGPIGVLDVERVDFANGVKALLWANNAEPGRVSVKVRFGGGYRAIDPAQAAYVRLGEMALISSGLGELGEEELDRISTGRKMGFDFAVDEGAFTFFAQTRADDLADQLYLFAAKLDMPRWDPNPILRAQAAARLAYESYATSPAGVLNRDLDALLRDGDARFATPDLAALAETDPEGFRAFWEPLLAQGPVELLIFGDFERDEAVAALARTFGALEPRGDLPEVIAARVPSFPDDEDTTIRYHRGDANQAAAVIAWPSGGGVAGLPESRQLEILVQLFNNRLFDAMRERAGASYAPIVRSEWPSDIPSGGRISALAQLQPGDVPIFFQEAERIADELATTPPAADELARVTEPLRQSISRASSGNLFWLYQLEGSTVDPRRIALLRSLLTDYSRTTPEAMMQLAQKYFGGREGWRLAVIPEGAELAGEVRPSTAPPVMQGR